MSADMSLGSLFAGIGGFDLAFERAGMTCAWQVEIDGKCNQVLGHHWPDVPRYGDVHDVGARNLGAVDVVCGGFPCQDLSVAGKREGLAGERSGLWFEFARIIGELKPRWVVVENVPGLLSSGQKRDMGILLGQLAEFGYMGAYRVLDAQFFGLAQRRRRVFIVGYLGDGRAAEVLFESKSGAWNPAPSREAGERVADPITKSFAKHGGASAGKDSYPRNMIIAFGGNNTVGAIDVATACNAHVSNRDDFESETFIAYTIQTNDGGNHKRKDRPQGGKPGQGYPAALTQYGVRRLTPTEAERLQGFPDGWTAIDGMSDSARYRMLGNAVAVPVVEWIGRRIVTMSVERFLF
jgi:DNA (cytosine-5)-methyltransferase 1